VSTPVYAGRNALAALLATLLWVWPAAASALVPEGPGPAQTRSALDGDAAFRFSQAAIGRFVGDYTLVDVDGRPVRLAGYRGKPLLINFIYTGCFQVCPVTTRMLKRGVEAAQRALGPDAFHVASIGFNLPFDSPDAMRAFARQQGVMVPGWDFLTPDAATLQVLAGDLGFSYTPSPRGFDHIIQITVLDARGRVYRQIYGDDFALPQLVEPLKELITGAPRRDVAGVLDRVCLLCTVYDPASGTYRFRYSLLFELAGGLIGLSATAWFFLRELRRSRAAASRAS
jgi:protein SCO1/2